MWECVALRTGDRPLASRYTNLNSHSLEMFTVKTNDNQKDPRRNRAKGPAPAEPERERAQGTGPQSLRESEPRAQGHRA